jgi:hypothetical protein
LAAPSLQKERWAAIKDRRTLLVSILALIVSGLALIVSGLSFYYSSLRVDDSLSARVSVLEFQPRESSSPPYRNVGAVAVVKIVFVNSGNRPAVISRIDYQYNGDGVDGRSWEQVYQLKVSQPSLPLLIPPREIRLLENEVPIEDVSGRRDDDPALRTWSFHLRLRFISISSRGQRFVRHSRFLGEVKVSAESVEYAPSPACDETIDLFQDDSSRFGSSGPAIPPI